jgi:hypothetical protein
MFRRVHDASIRNSDHPIATTHSLPSDINYSYPSVSSLATAFRMWLQVSISDSSATKKMQTLLSKYAYRQAPPPLETSGDVIFITDTTNTLGANILHIMSEDPGARHITCMGRPQSDKDTNPSKDDLSARQQRALETRGIALSSRALPTVDLLLWLPDRPNLGVLDEVTPYLASNITHMFHSARPMVKVASMQPQIKAVRDLVQLGWLAHAARPRIKPRVVLASSIAVVGTYLEQAISAIAPEKPINDPKIPLPMGHAEVKWVCEEVMKSVLQNLCEVEPVILRIGQLTGPSTTGHWNLKELSSYPGSGGIRNHWCHA